MPTMISRRRPPRTALAEAKPFLHIVSTVTFASPPTESLSTAEAEGLDEDRVAITNRSYWTRRVHALCSAARDPDAALRLLDRLRARGYRPDSLNLSSVVHALCAAGRAAEAHHRLILSAAAGWLPDDRTANVLLARLLGARTPRLTVQVFDAFLTAKPMFVPSLTNYNRLIDLLCSQSLINEARHLLVDMKTKGHHPTTVSYTAVMDGLSRNAQLDDARQVFDEMVDSGIEPNSLTYSVLIKTVLRKRRVEEARELMCKLWLRMRVEKDPSANSAAFANLMDAICLEGYFQELFRIAEEMPQGKYVLEEFAYGQMIDSLCRAGRHHGAARIVYIMRKRGFVPSMVSYNGIVHGLSKEGGCMRAYQLFEEGIGFGYSPSEATYKVLVEGLCQKLDVQKAGDVVEFMLQKDGTDRTRIYNIFLSALRLVDNPSEQLNVLILMLQKQCPPDVVTLNTVIHGFCKIGRVTEAMKILDDMLMGKFCAPDIVTFTTIIGGFLDAGKPEEALDIMRVTMPKCLCAPNVVTYNVLLHGLRNLQKIDEAMAVFDDMISKGICADSTTYSMVLNGFFDMGRLEEAKKFWDDVVWPSRIHDDYVYAAILGGLCHLGKFNEACDFLYELVDCGVAPGIVNYNILIDGAYKQGLKKDAYQIVHEMRKNRLKPDAATWRILDRFHKEEKFSYIASDRSSIPEGIECQRTMKIEVQSESASTIFEGKEWSNEIGKDMLEGLVDPSFDAELIDENNDKGHGPNVQYEKAREVGKERTSHLCRREPLSTIARRVFGLC